ncbi:hypothetical protein BO71DRAFT_403761 [Aspergillus ellipticus CBS 707.79]|uniref:Uncharacterized protein n=1 Tax=Aspergillus ellipticus CBS 707.79 TaxID=1448320 RepID=A0A319DBX5_9EURO|nr:hypothetical protein BO71DRAFT_403761 [Aspergillus ellipticus CBS 707.79]
MTWVSALQTIFHVTLYPLIILANWGYGLLRVLVVWPLARLGHLALQIVLLPWKFLAKFEAILSFLAFAVLTGIVLGLVQYHATRFTIETLHRWTGAISRTVFRRGRGAKQGQAPGQSSTSTSASASSLGDSGSSDEYFSAWEFEHRPWHSKDGSLLSSTILEEEELSQ